MFIFDNLIERQIGITLLKTKVNTFFEGGTDVLSGRHYNALHFKIKRKSVDG